MTFCVLGLQRSGTNFVERLLGANVEDGKGIENAWRNKGIWKHGYDFENKPEWDTDSLIRMRSGHWGGKRAYEELSTGIRWPIYIYKHPYNWLESITDKPVDIKKTYSLSGVDSSPNTFSGIDLELLAKLYVDHTRYYFNFPHKIYRLSYESLIDNVETTKYHVRNIAKFWNKEILHDDIHIINKVPQSDDFTEERRNRYKKIEIKKFSLQHLRIINSIIDQKTLQKQGYSLITTEEDYWRHKVSPI